MEWAIKKIQDLCTYTSSTSPTLMTLPPITVNTTTLLKEKPIVSIKCSSCTLPCSSHTNIPTHLNIDQSRPLHNTVPSYALHLIIFTGHTSWPGHLEDESFTGELIRCLDQKKKKEKNPSSSSPTNHRKKENTFHLYDYMNNNTKSDPLSSTLLSSSSHQRVLVTNSSLPSVYSTGAGSYDILLLPDNVMITNVTRKKISMFVDFIFGQPIHSTFDVQPSPWDQLILICGHQKKDKRCGTIGPLLQRSFENIIQQQQQNKKFQTTNQNIQVMLVSHLGGHAFAGNVVLYTHHGLRAIWYGRVTPCQCEDIINHSLNKDQVLQQHLRGILQVGEDRYDTPLTPIPSSLEW